jgi:steroid delta-isomerase-like uncharacterized protein
VDRHVDWRIVAPQNAGRAMIKAWPLPVWEPWREDSMSCESNKALTARHYVEVLTQKKLSVVDEIYADRIQVGDGPSMPREQFKAMAQMSTTAFPDLVATIHDQVAEGDLVATRWSAEGTHLGDFMGHAGSGRKATITAIHIHKITDNRIAGLWEEIDLLGLSKQLGIVI